MDNSLRSLLEQVREGDENAFAALSEEYSSVMENAVRRFAPSFAIEENGTAELYALDDLRQYASLALYKAASAYRFEESEKVTFGLYAKICINNALISQLRKFRSEKRRLEEMKRAHHTVRTQDDPLQQVASSEGAGELFRKIGGVLSSYEKEIFDAYVSGKSVREIAERLGKDEKSVSNALYRMKVKVRGLLKNQ